MSSSSQERAWLDASVVRINGHAGHAVPVTPWLAVEQFGYERRRHHSAALQLLATVQPEFGVPADQLLLVQNDASSSSYAPCASRIARPGARARLIDSPSSLLWRVEFAVPLDVVEYPHAVFSLTADGRAPIALPAPHLLSVDASRVRLSGARVRRHLVTLAAGLAVATASGSAVGVASAASGLRTPASARTHAKSRVTAKTAPGVTRPPVAQRHPKICSVQSHPDVTPPVQTTAPIGGARLASESENCHSTGPTHHPGSGQNGRHHRHHHRHRHHRHHHHPHDKETQQTHSASRVHDVPADTSHGPPHRDSRARGKATAPPAGALIAPALAPTDPPGSRGSTGFHLDPATVAAPSKTSSLLATDYNQPPAFLIPIYKAAAERYHVPWQILAAINWTETDYGANLNTSSAGAIGWMQFMPATWKQYGVAADGHGQPNPYSPQDAIFAAARYLAANGAARNLPKAIYAYNHATWYVVEVMQRAHIINAHASATTDTSLGGALNLDPVAIAALSQASSRHADGNQPPAFLIPIYKAAAHRYHVPWRILAAAKWIETNNGANLNTSSAGSMGWMQFTHGAWERDGVAADGPSKPHPHSPLDTIFSAALFLAVRPLSRRPIGRASSSASATT